MPQSIDGVDDLLNYFHKDVFIWAREKKTFNYLRLFNGRKYNFGISHDIAIALNLNAEELLPFQKLKSLNKLICSKGLYLNAFRKDKETLPNFLIPEHNYDLSILTEPVWPNKTFMFNSIDLPALSFQVSLFLNYISF